LTSLLQLPYLDHDTRRKLFETGETIMATNNAPLNLFLLQADGLTRCRWDGESESSELLNRALDGETVREVAPDPFKAGRLYAATLTEIHVSEDAGMSWQWLPSAA
jgi:hypothetical protein